MAKGGFRGGPMGGMNQAAMMKQVQKMQQEMLKAQEEMQNQTYTATAGGGMVTAVVNGSHEVVSLEIKPEAVDPEDVEMLQDMGHCRRERGAAHGRYRGLQQHVQIYRRPEFGRSVLSHAVFPSRLGAAQ